MLLCLCDNQTLESVVLDPKSKRAAIIFATDKDPLQAKGKSKLFAKLPLEVIVCLWAESECKIHFECFKKMSSEVKQFLEEQCALAGEEVYK